MGDLSAHFSRQELACPCCGRLQLEGRLLTALEKLRSLAKGPVLIHDGYRCPKHNREVGGVPESEHTRGCAADIALPGTALQRMYELALEVPKFRDGGIGVYGGGFLHVDVRPRQLGCAGDMSGFSTSFENPVWLPRQAARRMRGRFTRMSAVRDADRYRGRPAARP
jgi:hypothetical protein